MFAFGVCDLKCFVFGPGLLARASSQVKKRRRRRHSSQKESENEQACRHSKTFRTFENFLFERGPVKNNKPENVPCINFRAGVGNRARSDCVPTGAVAGAEPTTATPTTSRPRTTTSRRSRRRRRSRSSRLRGHRARVRGPMWLRRPMRGDGASPCRGLRRRRLRPSLRLLGRAADRYVARCPSLSRPRSSATAPSGGRPPRSWTRTCEATEKRATPTEGGQPRRRADPHEADPGSPDLWAF